MSDFPATPGELIGTWLYEAARHEAAAREIEDYPEGDDEALLHRVEAECLRKCASELAALPPVIPATETHGG